MDKENGSPLPLFDDIEIRKSLELIGKEGPVGRKFLAEKIGLGEGSVRTILEKLKNEGLVISTPNGHRLTEKGKGKVEKMRSFFSIDAGDLTVGEVDVATLIKGASEKVDKGIEQRDAAIKVGAEGATVLIKDGNGLRFPYGFKDVDDDFESLISEKFDMCNGDVVVIGTGCNELEAEKGAAAAVRSLE